MIFFIMTLNYLSIGSSQYLLIKTTELITDSQKRPYRQVKALLLILMMFIAFGAFAETPLLVGILSYILNIGIISSIVYVFYTKDQSREEGFQLWFVASFNLVFYYGLSYIGDVILTLLPKGGMTFV